MVSADTITQSVEHLHDKRMAWVRILASVYCIISSMLPCLSVGRSNFDRGLHNLIMLIQERHKDLKIKLRYKNRINWTFTKILLTKYYIYIDMFI